MDATDSVLSWQPPENLPPDTAATTPELPMCALWSLALGVSTLGCYAYLPATAGFEACHRGEMRASPSSGHYLGDSSHPLWRRLASSPDYNWAIGPGAALADSIIQATTSGQHRPAVGGVFGILGSEPAVAPWGAGPSSHLVVLDASPPLEHCLAGHWLLFIHSDGLLWGQAFHDHALTRILAFQPLGRGGGLR